VRLLLVVMLTQPAADQVQQCAQRMAVLVLHVGAMHLLQQQLLLRLSLLPPGSAGTWLSKTAQGCRSLHKARPPAAQRAPTPATAAEQRTVRDNDKHQFQVYLHTALTH
jgi:hypothetical protein